MEEKEAEIHSKIFGPHEMVSALNLLTLLSLNYVLKS